MKRFPRCGYGVTVGFIWILFCSYLEIFKLKPCCRQIQRQVEESTGILESWIDYEEEEFDAQSMVATCILQQGGCRLIAGEMEGLMGIFELSLHKYVRI